MGANLFDTPFQDGIDTQTTSGTSPSGGQGPTPSSTFSTNGFSPKMDSQASQKTNRMPMWGGASMAGVGWAGGAGNGNYGS